MSSSDANQDPQEQSLMRAVGRFSSDPSEGDDFEDDELNDLDDSRTIPLVSSSISMMGASATTTRRANFNTPGRTLSGSARFARTGTTSTTTAANTTTAADTTSNTSGLGAIGSSSSFNTNLWQQNIHNTGVVDQSVNLMDAERSQYENKSAASSDTGTSSNNNNNSRNARLGLMMTSTKKQKSMVDVFLSDSRHQSRGGIGSGSGSGGGFGVKDMASDDVYYHGRSQRSVRRWRLFFILLAVGLLVVGIYMRFPISNDNNNNNKKTSSEEETESPQDAAQGELVGHLSNEEIQQVPQTNRLDALRYFIRQQQVTYEEDLDNNDDDDTSAAHRAMVWMAQTDTAQLGIPGFDLTERRDADEATKELLERYAIACFFYSITTSDKNNNEATATTDEEVRKRGQFDNDWLQSEEHVCYWHGVVCEKKQGYSYETVTELRLADHLLSGTLPREIFIVGAMPHLTTVDLGGNRIRGGFPDVAAGTKMIQKLGLHSVAPLQNLFLEANQLTGDLTELMELANLEYLDLSGNAFTGSIPNSIVALTKLEELRLSDNKLEGFLTNSFVALTSLSVLNLKTNAFRGEIPVGLWDLTSLKELVLSENEFDNGIPTALGNLSNLTRLDLDGNSFTGEVPSDLGKLTVLERLRLSKNQLTGEMPDNLCSLVDGGHLRTLVADCTSGRIECDCCTFCV